jgi:hypothetical protein
MIDKSEFFSYYRQEHIKAVACLVAFCPNFTAVIFGNAFGYGKTQSEAAVSGSCGVGSIKPVAKIIKSVMDNTHINQYQYSYL